MQNKAPKSSEITPGPGYRIKSDFQRLDSQLMNGFKEFPTPDISDMLNRLYAIDSAIKCLTDVKHQLAGPACTIRTFPGDNLMVHKALDVAKPGDILVIAAGGASSPNAVLGDLVSTKATHRKIAGFIIDGLVRDLPGILECGLPVFARGTTPIGPLHRGPGEINFPVACGGVVVNPGDLIVADRTGIVVVPKDFAAELLDRLRQSRAANSAYLEGVQRGEFSNAWVDTLLQNTDCPIIPPDDSV